MPTIKVVNYTYNCPYCLKTKKSNDHIPMFELPFPEGNGFVVLMIQLQS